MSSQYVTALKRSFTFFPSLVSLVFAYTLKVNTHSQGGNEEQTLVHDCGGSGDGDTNSWCCAGVEGTNGQGQDCCSLNATTSLDSYPYSTITVITARRMSSTAVSSISSTSSSSSLESTPTPSISSMSTSSILSSPDLPPSPSPTSTPSVPASSFNNHSVAYGAGIGVPLGVLIFAALAMLLYRDRRNKKAIQNLQASLSTNRKAISDQEPLDISGGPPHRRNELSGGIDRGELPTGRAHQELP